MKSFEIVPIPHQEIGNRVQEWLDAKRALAALQERVKAIQGEIIGDPLVAPYVERGGYASLVKLGLQVAVCSYGRSSISTDPDKFEGWLAKQDDGIRMACKRGKYSLNKEVYDALPVNLKRKLDKHVKHTRTSPYLTALRASS